MRKLLFIKSISWNSTRVSTAGICLFKSTLKLRSSRIKLKKSPIFFEKLNMQIYNSFKALNLKDKISAVKIY
jgi:hypothetical protein